jgi:hypothetical protein
VRSRQTSWRAQSLHARDPFATIVNGKLSLRRERHPGVTNDGLTSHG